ncbi:ABC transporter permease [Mahella sp.]|uniref:ABC transporter permease n=1 Tax=Mahella sp. TaxID=2798721 RepID=UPI0025C24E0E|nr:ABC transporter permease [Mahella sp.]MBZ4665764.1 binding-protein-dependent transport system inner rane component [Mahella sp.]
MSVKRDTVISPERQSYLKQMKKRRQNIALGRILILIGIIVGWEAAADLGIIDPFITSQPSKILTTIVDLHNDGQLYNHIWATVAETMVGFIVGTALGTLMAIGLWWSDYACKILDPYLVVLNSLPKPALGPILIVWLGNGKPAIIAMALLISLIVTIITVLNGFLEVDKNKIKLLQTFGAVKGQILTKVILPASVPTIISALKINVGLSWVGVIMGEFLVSKEGLGYLIIYGSQVFELDLVMSSVIILAIVAAIMYQAVSYLETRFMQYKD